VASVFEKNGNYYLRWKDAAGRWRKQISACRTKRDAQRDADDLERKAERQSKGLEPLIEDAPQLTFAQLFEWWWEEYGSRLRGDNEPFARKRLLPTLGKFALVEVTAARIEALCKACPTSSRRRASTGSAETSTLSSLARSSAASGSARIRRRQ